MSASRVFAYRWNQVERLDDLFLDESSRITVFVNANSSWSRHVCS